MKIAVETEVVEGHTVVHFGARERRNPDVLPTLADRVPKGNFVSVIPQNGLIEIVGSDMQDSEIFLLLCDNTGRTVVPPTPIRPAL